ncbi:MAG: DUF5671 domain-containing protein [Candidatus Eisenbacteria bacterium]|nr:DUF5671 domain-containing protein [Candidatus Eisenbacteria bacterium]
MNNDLHVFVRDALARGVSRDDLKRALRDARWPDDEIDAEMAAWHDAGLGLPVPRRRVGVSAREAFLYLLMFVALYMVAYHTGAILYAWIEHTWPDPTLGTDVAYERGRGIVRLAVATLLVAFPVYLGTARITGRAVARDPDKRNSGVRRWLTYLTLFVAACVLIGDFIAVVLGMLNGDVTARFLCKAAVVAAIAGWMFSHYMGGLRRDEDAAPTPVRGYALQPLLARAAGVLVLCVIALGLWIAGSPESVRRGALDRKRMQDIDAISQAVFQYRETFGVAPETLPDMVQRSPSAHVNLRDPVTRAQYRYAVVDSESFRLCAQFDRPDSVGPWGEQGSEFWQHGAGEACFTFTFPARRGESPAVPAKR